MIAAHCSWVAKTDSKKLNKYLKGISGGKKYTVKDFRTYIGTETARKELIRYVGKTLSIKEKNIIIKKVTEKWHTRVVF